MPRDLFGDVTRPSISIGNRKWYTVPLSLLSHSAIVAMFMVIPILAPAVMPSVFADDDPNGSRQPFRHRRHRRPRRHSTRPSRS